MSGVWLCCGTVLVVFTAAVVVLFLFLFIPIVPRLSGVVVGVVVIVGVVVGVFSVGVDSCIVSVGVVVVLLVFFLCCLPVSSSIH